jgi:hypothetical protein
MRRLLAATLTLLITPYAAAATTPQQVTAGPSLLVGGWRILTACSNNHVVALFATPLAPRSGENFRSVAFQLKDGAWRSYGCRSACPQSAASAYESAMGFASGTLSAAVATNWNFLPESDTGNNTIETLALGVPEGHPVAGLIEASVDARPILALLVATGDTAADAPMFGTTESRDRFLCAVVSGLELELNSEESGMNELMLAVEEITTEPHPVGCVGFVVESPSWISGCSGNWKLTKTTEEPTPGPACVVVNVWHATLSQTEQRLIRKYYNDCTSCLVTQRRLRLGTGGLQSADFAAPCPWPLASTTYVPLTPSDPCTLANISWDPWSTWTPPAPGEPGSACP